MKVKIALLIALTLVSCGKMTASETKSRIFFLAPTPGLAAQFRSDLASFLAAKGFSPTTDPEGLSSRSGSKVQWMTTRWYTGSVSGSRPFLFGVSEVQVQGGILFDGDTSWSLRGRQSEVDTMRKQVSGFCNELDALVAKYETAQSGAANDNWLTSSLIVGN